MALQQLRANDDHNAGPSPGSEIASAMTKPHHLLDQQLRAAKRGEEGARRWLWSTFAGPVTGFLQARGTPDVGEVVNDVFLAAFGHLDAFRGDASEFRGWLYGIARNKRADHLRRASRRPPSAPMDGLEHPSVDDVEEAALRRVGDDDLVEVLGSLTSDQRDVIVLRFVSDLSLEQTAVAVGKPVGAVKAIQHRALAQLRKRLAGIPYPPTPLPTT